MSLSSPALEPGRFSDLRNGPKHPHQRDCTDFLCCVVMLLNISLLGAFVLYGYSRGDVRNIYRGTDQDGNICGGSRSGAASYPYVYFYNPTTQNLSRRLCVDSCPSYSNGTLLPINCYKAGSRQGKCDYDVVVQEDGSLKQEVGSQQVIGYESTAVVGRVCMPAALVFSGAFAKYGAVFNDRLRQGGLANFATDIQNNWRWLLLAMVLAVLISVLFMLFLRNLAGCFIWVSLLLILLTLLGVGMVFLYNGGAIRGGGMGKLGMSMPSVPTSQYYNIFGYIVLGVTGLVLLLWVCCCSRISLAVALCGVAGRFIAGTWQVMLVPIIMGLLVFGLWVGAVIGMVCLVGTSAFVVNEDDVFTVMQSYSSESLGYFYYTLFATLWVNSLLLAITIFVVAASCTIWYYSKAPGVELDSPVASAFYMAFRFHFGSLSLGALIMAIVQIIQLIFEILVKKLQVRDQEDQNKCLAYVACCVHCCLDCISKIIQLLNKNAYIVIAVTGKDFISASADAMSLITGNPLRYGVVGVVGYILGILGKLTISALTTFLFYLFITFVSSVKTNIQEPIYMLILVGIGSYAVALIFMSIFDVTVDSLFVCFLIDEKSNGKAVFAPVELSDLMDK